MDYEYHYEDGEHGRPQQQPSSNGLASAALICGIISLCTICCFYLSIPVAALSILFALLSKGYNIQMNNQARTGMILALLALVISAVLIVFALSTGNVQKTIDQYYKNYSYSYDFPFGNHDQL